MTEKPKEAMRGRHRTYDPSGFEGFTASRKRTLKKLPTLAHIKTDVPLSAAALAAHEASFAKEDSEGLAPRLSPRFMELKAGEESKHKKSQKASLVEKRKTKEDLDAEFETVYADMAEEISQAWLYELHQHWAAEMIQQKKDARDFARRNAVYYVDHIMGADWNKVNQKGVTLGGVTPSKAEVQELKARVPRRLSLSNDDVTHAKLEEFLLCHAGTCGGDDESNSDEDGFGEDSGSDSD
jgi:hypothetical protein